MLSYLGFGGGKRRVFSANDLRLAELLAARLCHELVSPIGAIGNGVEILEEDAGFAADATDLIGQSARAAAARLQFYRIAYGATADIADALARAAAVDLLAEGKVTLDWPPSVSVPAGWQKLVCNLVLLAAESLPRGGTVTLLAAAAARGGDLAVRAQGRGAQISEATREFLSGRATGDALSPRTVQAAFTTALAQRIGVRIEPWASDLDAVVLVLVR